MRVVAIVLLGSLASLASGWMVQGQELREDLKPDQGQDQSQSERVIRMQHGLHFTLPAGWRVDGEDADDLDDADRRRVRVVCKTPECKRSQETCTFFLFANPVEGPDDRTRLASLYATPLARYFRLRDVLKSTSRDAEIRENLAIQRIGPRDWYAVETDARHNYKSGYFAETVIDGHRLRATCKTCETGQVRHQAARAILATVGPQRTASATH